MKSWAIKASLNLFSTSCMENVTGIVFCYFLLNFTYIVAYKKPSHEHLFHFRYIWVPVIQNCSINLNMQWGLPFHVIPEGHVW